MKQFIAGVLTIFFAGMIVGYILENRLTTVDIICQEGC